jgi:hypothetical protein
MYSSSSIIPRSMWAILSAQTFQHMYITEPYLHSDG